MDTLETKTAEALESIKAQVKTEIKDRTDVIDRQITELSSVKAESKEYGVKLDSVEKNIKALGDQIVALAQKHDTTTDEISTKGFGKLVMESKSIQGFINGETTKGKIEVKNTILNNGNSTSQHDTLQGLVPGAMAELTVMPTIPMGQTDSNSVFYSKESNWINGAASQVEGATKATSTLTFAEVNEPVRTIAHTLKVSKQSLSDSPFLESYVEMRMKHGIEDEKENQVINGDGSGVNMSGLLKTGNHSVVSPTGTVDIFGLANKLKTAIKVNKYKPAVFYINPEDWGNAETERRASGDNAFVAASGAVSYPNGGLTPLLWGLPVVQSTNVAAGTLICADPSTYMYVERESTVVEMFEQDGDNVEKNLITVRAEVRGALLVFTASGVATGDITSIT